MRDDLRERVESLVRETEVPPEDAPGGKKKNYTETVSRGLCQAIAGVLIEKGLQGVRAPDRGPDKQFMGGYGTKGVDVYLSDEKHGLLLTSGVKGLVYDPRKNLL